MSLQVVPTPDGSTPFWTETVTLDGAPFILVYTFNQRVAAWYVSVQTIDGTDIIDGIKLVAGWDLLIKCANASRPPGKLFVLSNSTDWTPPGLNDLAAGGRCVLCYFPIADFEALP